MSEFTATIRVDPRYFFGHSSWPTLQGGGGWDCGERL